MKHIKYPSIEQFNNVVRGIQQKAQFVEKLEDGTVIVDRLAKMPVIEFTGYIKNHGTNAGICWNKKDGIWYQSRENIISVQYDNAGFAAFSLSKNGVFQKLFSSIANKLDIVDETICIFGEWAGKGIQKGVGINNIPKSFFIFGLYIFNETENTGAWIDYDKFDLLTNNQLDEIRVDNIYHIKDFKSYKITIDFNTPLDSQSTLHDLTMEVEKECPVAKSFGFDGIGEGIVWGYLKDGELIQFKTKGELHANGSKVKVVKNHDNERQQLIYDIAEKVTPVWRLEQMMNLACDTLNGGIVEPKKLGEYLKLINNDICKEDSLIIAESGLTFKDIVSTVARISKDYFLNNLTL